jgi:hypothetical protein
MAELLSATRDALLKVQTSTLTVRVQTFAAFGVEWK